MSEKTNKLLIIKSTFILKRLFSLLVAIKKLDLIIYNKILQRKLLIGIDDYKKESGKIIIGKRNGLGKEYGWNNALMFEGGFKNDYRWNDKGYNPWNKIVYELKDRKGIVNEYNEKDKLVFKGKYVNGKRNGEGKEYNEEG